MDIYLDHAAATPLDSAVLAAMQPYFTEKFYNPSSPYAPAVAVRREYESAKSAIAAVIGARSGELIMTAGATESINLAFSGGDVMLSQPLSNISPYWRLRLAMTIRSYW